MNLIVAFPFGPYTRGQCIVDAAEIELILLGENAGCVRKVPAEIKADEPAEPVGTPTDAVVDNASEPAA